MENDIVIIGAGACGLMAGRILAGAGRKVLILEAQDRIGGRIQTIYDDDGQHRELGAEFIHGKLPVTLALAREAGLDHYKASDEMWRRDEEGLRKEDDFIEGWDELIKKLKELKEEVSIEDFLETNFPGAEYAELRASVRNYAEGYDTADPKKGSAIALREEWQEEIAGQSYRLKAGYGKMIAYLLTEYMNDGGLLERGAIVKKITWVRNKTEILTTDGRRYSAPKVIVTVPMSILQSDNMQEGNIEFSPALPEYMAAARQIGYGNVIKVLLEFTEAFWEQERPDLENACFIFSEEAIPTWWLQNPEKRSLLTGWLGGPSAKEMSQLGEEKILAESLVSLSAIFEIDVTRIEQMLKTSLVADWNKDPFARGSYSYASVGANQARVQLTTPVDDTIYFAGEALLQGTEVGTVEAALGSGKAVAEKILVR